MATPLNYVLLRLTYIASLRRAEGKKKKEEDNNCNRLINLAGKINNFSGDDEACMSCGAWFTGKNPI